MRCIKRWKTLLAPQQRTGSRLICPTETLQAHLPRIPGFSGNSLMGCLQFCFHFAVTTNSGFSIEPRARRRRRTVFPTEALLIERMLPIIGRYHMRKIGIVNVPAMELICGRPLEGIGRGFVDEGSQKLSFTLSKHHA